MAASAAVDVLEYGLACDTATLDAAFRLLHDQYVRCGYMSPHPSGRRLSLYHALPSTRVFAARAEREVVGTLSLIEDSPLGLPMEEIYSDEVSRLRARGRRVSEMSALSMETVEHRHGVSGVLGLIRMAQLYAAEVARLDDLCLSVNPRHVGFYQKFLGCEPIGPRRSYRSVNGAPAEPLRLDLGDVRRQITELHIGLAEPSRRGEYLFGIEIYRRIMVDLRRDSGRARLSRAQFEYFFAGHEVLAQAPESHRLYVASLHERGVTHERGASWMPQLVLPPGGFAPAV